MVFFNNKKRKKRKDNGKFPCAQFLDYTSFACDWETFSQQIQQYI